MRPGSITFIKATKREVNKLLTHKTVKHAKKFSWAAEGKDF